MGIQSAEIQQMAMEYEEKVSVLLCNGKFLNGLICLKSLCILKNCFEPVINDYFLRHTIIISLHFSRYIQSAF